MDKIIQKIEDVIDSFLNEYDSDHTIIRDDNEKISEFYKTINGAVSNWNKSKQCMVQGCKNRSIKRSHTIQKSNSLKLISEEGKVLTPSYSVDGCFLKEVGINNASTFPGFCQHHEKLFETFETSKTFSDIQGYALQLYRTVCREDFRLKFEISYLTKVIEDHIKTRNEYLISRIKEEIGVDIDYQSLSITNDYSVSVMEKWKSEKLNLYKNVHDFYNDYSNDIFNNSKSNEFSILNFSIDLSLPVCISSLFTFFTETKGITDNVLAFINILPFKDKTLILFCSRSSQFESIKTYLSHYNNSPSILNMIEAWMVLQTDHWFLKPSVWNKKDEIQKETILARIKDYDEKALETDISIFDDIRKTFISSANSQINTPGKKKYFEDIVKKESHKLNNKSTRTY